MDSALRPRDIQARIRSGRSVDEVAAAAGMPPAMVARFAAPVLAEREYVAAQAMTAPVRRRGEPSGHRKLRVAIAERLISAQVDIDDVAWDSARMEDGRWAVIARYRLDETDHEAIFHFDVGGRFSVAGNPEARWLLGEHVDPADEEPTVELASDGHSNDRDDDMALVRSVSEPVRPAPQPSDRVESAPPGQTQQVADVQPQDQNVTAPTVESQPTVHLVPEVTNAEPDEEEDEETGGLDVLYDILDRAGTEYTEDSVEIPADDHHRSERTPSTEPATEPATDSGDPAVSDAAAVPDTVGGDYAPAVSAAAYPVEPSLFDDEPEFSAPAEPAPAEPEPTARRRRRARSETAAPPSTPDVAAPDPAESAESAEPAEDAEPATVTTGTWPQYSIPAETAERAESAEAAEPAEEQPAPVGPLPDDVPTEAARKKPRKRASVPSWDEIMFGSPRSKG